jgi:hypothetical protein
VDAPTASEDRPFHHNSQEIFMPKNSDKETTTSAGPEGPQPSSRRTTADLGKQYSEAQQKFAGATNDANLDAYNTLLTAYRDYATELYNAQHEFEGYALEVYQKYLAKLSQASGSDVAGETGNDHYWEFVRLTTELSGEGGWRESVEKAYRDLMKAFALTKDQADSVIRQAGAYRAYVEQLTEAWKQAEPTQRQAEQAYLAYVEDCKEGLKQGQTALESAYQDYLKDLNQAYVSSDFEQRASAATGNYLAKAREAWKLSQSLHTDATNGLIETQENLLRNVQPERSV